MTPSTQISLPPGSGDKAADRDDRPKARIAASGGTHSSRNELRVDIHGLDSRELELMKGAMHGHQWVTCRGGRIEHVPTYEPLPGPAQDEAMMPFWRRPGPGTETQLSLFAFEPMPVWSSPSITIGSLCGYGYSEENYRRQAASVARWGFVCLRSPRDDSGQFHEQWYLPGLWAAKEELKAAIHALDPGLLQEGTAEERLRGMLHPAKEPEPPATQEERQKRALETAVRFLSRNAQFGTLDVSIQRAAMRTPD